MCTHRAGTAALMYLMLAWLAVAALLGEAGILHNLLKSILQQICLHAKVDLAYVVQSMLEAETCLQKHQVRLPLSECGNLWWWPLAYLV